MLSNQTDPFSAISPDIASLGNTIVVSWSEGDEEDRYIIYVTSTDGGISFGAITRVPSTNSTSEAFDPHIALFPTAPAPASSVDDDTSPYRTVSTQISGGTDKGGS